MITLSPALANARQSKPPPPCSHDWARWTFQPRANKPPPEAIEPGQFPELREEIQSQRYRQALGFKW